MADRPEVSDALARLDRALVALEQVVEKRQAKALSAKALQDDLQRMSKERSDLTQSLDEVKARSDKLVRANEEVSRRLVAAMESVRTVLEQHGG
jgi:SMC interacting uncharacterized protein involved in chromosome segregation